MDRISIPLVIAFASFVVTTVDASNKTVHVNSYTRKDAT
jgi:hypothetical protein